jgi:hypothetical protein
MSSTAFHPQGASPLVASLLSSGSPSLLLYFDVRSEIEPVTSYYLTKLPGLYELFWTLLVADTKVLTALQIRVLDNQDVRCNSFRRG